LPRSLPGVVARLVGASAAFGLVAGLPAVVAAHGLSPVYQSPLPLAVYLVGAAATVALSFVFVLARDLRATPPEPGRIVRVPAPVRWTLRLAGVTGWAWILAQGIAGGSSDGAVATLFLWVYGWVGVAALSALVAPVWEWLDPFATLFDAGAWVLRRLGVRGMAATPLPASLRGWPAAAGFAFFVWLELVAVPGNGTLTVVLAGYTVLTMLLMAQFGRDAWRAQGEVFSTWFRTLNLLAPIGIVTASTDAADGGARDEDEDDDAHQESVDARHVVRRPFASGLLAAEWPTARIVLVALGVASIMFDGLSQTVAFASVFGTPGVGPRTVLLLVFLALVVGLALGVARAVSPGAIGAGLLPIAVGYLVAHYLTYLLIDGQRIVIAISDPLQTGADLFGTAFYTLNTTWLPPGLVWTVQLAAVVGGHMLGAWAGHVTAQRDWDRLTRPKETRDRRHRVIHETAAPSRNVRAREIPLAVVMVALTTLTLWSLGQSIVKEVPAQGSAPVLPGPLLARRDNGAVPARSFSPGARFDAGTGPGARSFWPSVAFDAGSAP